MTKRWSEEDKDEDAEHIYCEQCGDCILCYAEDVCPVTGLTHAEMTKKG